MEQQRLKVHRRKTHLDGAVYTVLSPRADEGPVLSVDIVEDGATITGDTVASGLLGQLCWAMAYQHTPYTIAVVDGVAEAPVVVVNLDLGEVSEGSLTALGALLPWTTTSDGTVNLNTRSLESAVANEPAFYADQKKAGIGDIKHQSRFVRQVGDVLVLGAPAIVLKSWGVQLSTPDDARPKWFLTSPA
ncbi:MAG: hypothetical protein V9G12_04490 [Microthrixaceae bacterium]